VFAGNARVHNTGRRRVSNAPDRAHHARLEVAEDFRQALSAEADCRLNLGQTRVALWLLRFLAHGD
jgi:hypothetical protein